jgi:hypothetical protein
MPSITVASVISEAQSVYLNDAAGSVYTDAILLPFIKSAYEHLRNELALNDVPTLNELSAAQTITAGSVTLTSAITDLLVPLALEERASGSSDLYVPMVERQWVPNEAQTSALRYWVWREEAIIFLGATTDRQIRVRYLKDLDPTAITTSSTIFAANARSFLAARTAALVEMFVRQNVDNAQAAQMVADEQLRKIIMINVKNMQALPTRRRPFLGPRRIN